MEVHSEDTEDSMMEIDTSTGLNEMDSEYEESNCSSPRGASLPSSEDAEWKPDPSVPQGWLIKEFLTRTGQKLEHIKSPVGTFFPGRKAAMEWMKEREYSLEDIRLMQSRLKIRWIENDPSVPTGWKTRKSKIRTNGGMTDMEWFLSPSGKMYRGKKAILKAIQTDPGIFTEDEIRKFKTVPVPIKKFSAEYNWNDSDETLPPGWRSSVINMNSFGKIVETMRYLAPDGRFCTSRVEAIKHMMKDENMHDEDLETMKKGLLADGWISSDELPCGWYMKPDSGRGARKEAHYNYLAPDMTYLRSTKAALTHMMADPASYSQEDMNKLQAKSRKEGNKLRPDKYDWISDNETVPEGWKLRIVHCSNGLDREFLLAPDGASYSGRKQALDFLRKSGTADPEAIRRLESGCKVVWTEDDPTLPPGWKSRTSEINAKTGKQTMQWFLNPDGKMFRGRKAALEFIQNCGKYSKQEMRKFKFVLPDNKKTNYTWNSQDTSVPEGWYTTIINMNSFGKIVRSKRFMAPDGRFCSSRDEAIKYMIKEGLYEDSEIEIMEAGYEEDMEQTEIKTEGWDINTSNEESPQKRMYMTDSDSDFNSPQRKKIKREVFTTSEDNTPKIKKELTYDSDDEMKNEVNSDEEEMEENENGNFRVEMQDDRDDKDFIPKLKITKIKPTKASTAKKDDTDSSTDNDDKTAITAVKKEPLDEQSCYRLKSGRLVTKSLLSSPRPGGSTDGPVMAKDEGWVDDDPTVPAGWRTKEYVNKGGQKVKHVMSPEGTFFAGRKAALESMEAKEGEYSQEDIEIMQSGLKVIWNEEDPSLPKGWKSRTTEVKTGKPGTPTCTMYWYKSPSGKMFRGKKSALRFMESSKHCTPEDVRKFKSTQGTDKKFTKDYKWNDDDPSLPQGWKSTVIQMNSFGKIVPSTRFLAPDGRYCANRIDALRYMVKEGIYSQKEMDKMKEALTKEGWMKDPKLPAGWYMKPRKDKGSESSASYYYLTEAFQQFDSTKAAVRFMQSEPEVFTKQDINKLESKIFSEVKKLTPDKYTWSEDPATLPPCWKYRTVMCSNGLERHFFLAPDGSSYSGRKQALEYMKKIGSSSQDIKKMESMLQVQWIDDDPNLPKGWRTRWTDMKTKTGVINMQWFLSPQGKMFRGKKSALEFITNSGEYTKEDIRKIRCSGDNVGNKTGYDWEDDDPSIPPGWKGTTISVNSFGKMVQSRRYLSPDGRFCSSRIEALKYMLKENIFKEEDIAHMKNSLLSEGWETDNLLPAGWLIKPDKHKEEEATFNYLSPDFQFMRSTRAAQTYMQNCEDYNDEDVKKLGQLIAEEKRKIRMDKYGPGSSSKSPMASRRQSESFSSISPRALFNNSSNNGFESTEAQELIKKLSNGKDDLTWDKHELLPNGWTLHKIIDDDIEGNESNEAAATDVIFKSKTGQLFDSYEAALEEIREAVDGEYSSEEVDNFNKMGEELRSLRTQNSGKYDWNCTDPTIPSGWKSRVVEGKLRRQFFLCPDGSVFACRRSGFQHMVQNKFPSEEVESMRELLTHEGWKFADFLPKGWMIRKTEGTRDGIYDVDFWMLNIQGNVFRSTKTAIEFLTNSKDYGQSDIDKITTELEKERRQARMLKYDWLENDPSVPIGWRLRHVDGKSARRTFFLSKDGFQFACRRAAYQHMITENYPEEELSEMRDKLSHEGWQSDPLLPEKWLVRKCEGSTNGQFDVNYYFLSKEGVMFHSIKAAITHMTQSELYNEHNIEQIKIKLEQEIRKNRPQKYDWLEDENLPEGWKYRTVVKAGIRTDFVLTNDGDQFQSRRAAIEHLIKEGAPTDVILKFWSTLDTEGWIFIEGKLPQGWRVRSKDRLKDNWQFYFLSPQMEVFKSNKTVLDSIAKDTNYTQNDYNLMKQWIEDEQKARREENYTWSEESNLPPGWKVRSVVTNSKNIREFFLTPDGDQIAGRRKAIELMRENGASQSLLDAQTRKMKEISNQNSSKGGKHNNRSASSSRRVSSQVDDSSHDFFSDEGETEFEDMQMMMECDEDDENPHEISLEGMIPEFEPVEITAVQHGGRKTAVYGGEDDFEDDEMSEVDIDDDDEFNDVEEITDDQEIIEAENIKVEPDINFM